MTLRSRTTKAKIANYICGFYHRVINNKISEQESNRNMPNRDYPKEASRTRSFKTIDEISSEQFAQQTTCIVRNKQSTNNECDVASTSQDYNDVSFRLAQNNLLQNKNKLNTRLRGSRNISKYSKNSDQVNRITSRRANNKLGFHIFLILLLFTRCTNAVWWSPSTASQLVETKKICQWARQVGGAPAQLCRENLPVISKITQGIEEGVEECQRSFRNDRWNCSQMPRAMLGKVLRTDIKQTAYFQAITAAAILHSITMGCVNGELPECGCGKKSDELKRQFIILEAEKMNVTLNESKLNEMTESFWWDGCDDNVEYGYIKSQAFLNQTFVKGRHRSNLLRTKVNLHNFEAGRLAIKNHMKTKSVCHGMSNTCTIHTSWKVMPSLSDVNLRLKVKYRDAVRVASFNNRSGFVQAKKRRRPSSRSRASSRPSKRRRRPRASPKSSRRSGAESNMLRRNMSEHRKNIANNKRRRINPRRRRVRITAESLVYTRPSPTFCTKSKRYGSVGTVGRMCLPKVKGIGGCKYLCCGRGFKSKVIKVTKKCNCHFKKCCNLMCEECQNYKTVHVCL